MVTLLLACSGTVPDASIAPMLDPVALLVRASLDLRGVRPSEAELERVENNPDQLAAALDDLLTDARFYDRLRDLFAEVTLTRTETWPYDFSTFGSDAPYEDIVASVGDHPQRVFAHVVANDLPITDLVTADWTVADETLASLWPVDRPTGSGWVEATWTDGRPAAGILTSTSLWWRYANSDSNLNRKRANQVSRILLCHDYLTRPIEFDRNVNLLDEAALADAVANDPGCQVCHVSLDPIAAYMFGFSWVGDGSAEVVNYHPARERNWEDTLGVAPAWYGTPGTDLSDLGRQIAADSRFPECMVQRAWEGLMRRDVRDDDFDRLVALRETLITSGSTLKPVFRAILDSDEYRAAPSADATDAAVPLKLASAQLLASQIEDLTGYRLVTETTDLLTSDVVGYLSLAGGADGVYATKAIDAPNTTLLLVQERLAEAAATAVVASDLADPLNAHLFNAGALDSLPGSTAFVDQVQRLHWRIFGRRVESDGDEVSAAADLWNELRPVVADDHEAWAALLGSLLRDPDLLLY